MGQQDTDRQFAHVHDRPYESLRFDVCVMLRVTRDYKNVLMGDVIYEKECLDVQVTLHSVRETTGYAGEGLGTRGGAKSHRHP